MNEEQAKHEQAIDDLTVSPLIDESNLSLAFNHYQGDELIDEISSGRKFIRLNECVAGYRTVCIEGVKSQIACDDDFTMKLIELAIDDGEKVKSLVNKKIDAIIKCEISQIKVDWFDLLNGVE